MALAGGLAAFHYQAPNLLARGWDSVLGLFGRELISVEVMTTPARADILLDGERITDLPARIPRDGADHQVTAVAPGYEPAAVAFRADHDRQIYLTLKRAKPH